MNQKVKQAQEIIKYFKTESIEPAEINPALEALASAPINQKVKMFGVLARPSVALLDFALHSEKVKNFISQFNSDSIEQAEILMKYEGYIFKENEMAEKIDRKSVV